MRVLVKNDNNEFTLENVEATQGGVPTGVIVMWSGLLSAIPTGWNLCNGANGTPDLRDRFIVGSSAGVNPGITGGSNSHTHTNHTVTQPTAHGTQAIKYANSGTALTVLTNTNNHTGSAVTAHNTVDNRPLFYSLAFIMKG